MAVQSPNDLTALVRGSGRGTAATLLTRVSDVAATYGYYAVLARALSVEHFGLFVLATTVLQFATALARRGLDQIVVALPPSGGLNRFVARSIGLAGIGIAIVAAVVIRIADLPAFAFWFAAAVPLAATGQLVISALRARAKVTHAAIAEGIVQPVSALAGVAIVAATSPSLENFALAFLSSWAITLTFAFAVEWNGAPLDSESEAKLHERGRSMLGVFLLNQAAVAADILLLGFLASATDVARYAAALKIAAALEVLQGAVTSTTAPFIQRAAHDRALLAEYLAVVTRWTLLVCLPLLVITVGAPSFILNLAFGAEYATASATLLVILSIARMALVMSGPAGTVLLCTGHEKIYFRIQLASTVMLVLAIAAVANNGATAVALVMLAGTWINRGLLLIMMRRFTGVTPWDRGASREYDLLTP